MNAKEYELRPDGPTSYAVIFHGKTIGSVGREPRARDRGWYLENKERGWYSSEMRTRQKAIDSLVDLYVRNQVQKGELT
jgi:hypothetical protein